MFNKKSIILFLCTHSLLFFTLTPIISSAQYEKGDSLSTKFIAEIEDGYGIGEDTKEIKTLPEGAILITKEYINTTLGHYKVEHEGEIGYIPETSVFKIDEENRKGILRWKEERERLREEGLELLVSFTNTRLNSADGLSFIVKLFNNSEKRTIKYVRFYLAPFNAVGDMVRGTVEGESEKTVRGVGPINPKNDALYEFDNVWYNSTIKCVELRRIDVDYTDGHSFTYINDLAKVIKDKEDVDMRGDCSK